LSRIVILGGGYGGVTVVHHLLEKNPPEDTEIVLIDRMPFQGLKTEYYSLAAGTVCDKDIRVNFPSHPQLRRIYGEVADIGLDERIVRLADGNSISYDTLVIALGCTDNYHGIEGAREHACSIQSFASTRQTYQLLNDVKAYGQVTIVGGGLSGVELAAELRESRPDLNIRILDRGASILSSSPVKLQQYVASWFRDHEVEMLSHISITRLEKGVVHHQGGAIETDVTVWTAGIQPVELVQRMALPKDRIGRLIVSEWHELPDYPNVFVVGDCASHTFSPSAQLAEAQGKQAAEVIAARLHHREPKLGRIKLKGLLGSLGKKNGFWLMGDTPIIGRVPRLLKSGVLWMSKHHIG